MDENQQELRHAAAEAFMESLNQLSLSLQPDEQTATQSTQKPNEKPNQKPNHPPAHPLPASQEFSSPDRSSTMDIHALEDAAADIEQFMQTRVSQTE